MVSLTTKPTVTWASTVAAAMLPGAGGGEGAEGGCCCGCSAHALLRTGACGRRAGGLRGHVRGRRARQNGMGPQLQAGAAGRVGTVPRP